MTGWPRGGWAVGWKHELSPRENAKLRRKGSAMGRRNDMAGRCVRDGSRSIPIGSGKFLLAQFYENGLVCPCKHYCHGLRHAATFRNDSSESPYHHKHHRIRLVRGFCEFFMNCRFSQHESVFIPRLAAVHLHGGLKGSRINLFGGQSHI